MKVSTLPPQYQANLNFQIFFHNMPCYGLNIIASGVEEVWKIKKNSNKIKFSARNKEGDFIKNININQ
jgi:hypothetical protein